MFRSLYETRHFEFDAYGETPEKAEKALVAGWAEHCREFPSADEDLLKDEWDLVYTYEVKPGFCYRDREYLGRYDG